MHLRTCAFLTVSLCAAPSFADAGHAGDIALFLSPVGAKEFRIETGLLPAKGDAIPGERVFASEMGEAGVPHATDEPGFDAEPGTFEPGSSLTFACPEGLFLFTGDGVAPAGSERLEISFLFLTRTVGSSPVDGFPLLVPGDGGWHRHFVYRAIRTDGGMPQPSIYVLPMALASNQAGVATSETFWIVFNDGRDEKEHEAAIAWVEEHLAGGHACPADLDGDGTVGASDLATLLAAWAETGGPADLDGDGTVGAGDLTTLLAAWGPC